MKHSLSQSPKAIIIFLLITFLFSSLFYGMIIYTGKLESGFGMYAMGLMWCPGIAALITIKIFKGSLSSLGWQWGKNRYEVASFIIPFLYTLIAYIIIWFAGWGEFYNIDFIKKVSRSFGWEALPDGAVILFYIIVMGTVGLIGSAASALGEEIGWRGFLVPALMKHMNFTKTSLLTGAVWAFWHFPPLLFANYNSGTPAWYGLTCFTVMIISISFIYTWFRLRSNSLWTAVILHASHNLFIQSIFSPLTKDTGNTKYFTDEFGVVLPVVCVLAAFIFWKKRSFATSQ